MQFPKSDRQARESQGISDLRNHDWATWPDYVGFLWMWFCLSAFLLGIKGYALYLFLGGAAGASSVPTYQQDVARVFRFSKATQLRQIVMPHALPSIVTGLRLSMGVAWMVIVAAEMLSAASGIGFYVWQSYNGPGLTHVISAVLLIGAVGVALDLAFQMLGKLVAHEEARP